MSRIRMSGASRFASSSVCSAVGSLTAYFILIGGFEYGAQAAAYEGVIVREQVPE